MLLKSTIILKTNLTPTPIMKTQLHNQVIFDFSKTSLITSRTASQKETLPEQNSFKTFKIVVIIFLTPFLSPLNNIFTNTIFWVNEEIN